VGLVLLAVAAAFWTGGEQLTKSGLEHARELIKTVWLRLLLGFTLGGLIQVLVPRALITKWLGPTSGLKGILIGSYMGIIMPGPPYVIFPIIASIYRAGAGAGPIIALLAGRALLGLQHLIVWQIPFLGVGIPLATYIVCLFLTPLVGLAGAAVFKVITRSPQVASKSNQDVCNAGQQPAGEGKTDTTSERTEKWT